MEIWNCEFCNTSVTNFEVHYCRNFGNQHRQSFATLPRSSSANWVQDTESRTALPMNYEARWPDMSQFNSSIQQSVLPNMHLRTDWEAAATAEISSSYGIAKYNQYNLEISDFLLPNMPHGPENQYNSTTLPNADQLNPMPVAEPCSLPGFQQAFGQRNTLMNQIHQHPNACQMDSSGTSRTDVMSSSFTFAFNEIDNISNNQISQHYETSSGIPILAVQNAQFNPMDPVPPTDAISPIHSKECPKEFLPKDYLEPQDRSHSVARPYASSYCDKTFPCSAHLTRHIRTHTGDKPYACTMCNKCFAQSSGLTKHVRTHTGDKPYACNICNKRFADSSSLIKHKRTHTGEKPYACKICNKRFSCTGSLNEHMRIHTGERSYACKVCNERFSTSSNLTKHIRIHTGEKPYKCTECDMKYVNSSSLKHHMLQHAGEQRRKCDSCGAEFTSEDSLAAHKCKKNK